MGRVVNATARPIYPWEWDAVPTAQEAGWASESVCTGAENFIHTGIRFPDRPARNELLYWLRYPEAHNLL
jgi:hypothetical protein